LASTTDDLAPERSGAAREETEHTPKAPAEARSERNTGSGAGKSAPKSRSSTSDSTPRSGGKSGGSGASRKSADDVPIARYDSLTAAEVVAHLRKLSQRELAKVERYEKRHDSRQTILSRIDSLREDEPWRGYDDATVDEVRKKLTNADDDRARAARDYERRHRERKGVMEAARRTLRST
jgi:hypothetical protein